MQTRFFFLEGRRFFLGATLRHGWLTRRFFLPLASELFSLSARWLYLLRPLDFFLDFFLFHFSPLLRRIQFDVQHVKLDS